MGDLSTHSGALGWDDKCRKAIEAWNFGRNLGFPLIRPGLEAQDPDQWMSC